MLAPHTTTFVVNDGHHPYITMFKSYLRFVNRSTTDRFLELSKGQEVSISVVNPHTFEGTRPVFILESPRNKVELAEYFCLYISNSRSEEDWLKIFPGFREEQAWFGFHLSSPILDEIGRVEKLQRKARLYGEMWWQEIGQKLDISDGYEFQPLPLSVEEVERGDKKWSEWYIYRCKLIDAIRKQKYDDDDKFFEWWQMTNQQLLTCHLAVYFHDIYLNFIKFCDGLTPVCPEKCGQIYLLANERSSLSSASSASSAEFLECKQILQKHGFKSGYGSGKFNDSRFFKPRQISLCIIFEKVDRLPKNTDYCIIYSSEFSKDLMKWMRWQNTKPSHKRVSDYKPDFSEQEILDELVKLEQEKQHSFYIQRQVDKSCRMLRKQTSWKKDVEISVQGQDLVPGQDPVPKRMTLFSENDIEGLESPDVMYERMKGKTFKVTYLSTKSILNQSTSQVEARWWSVSITYQTKDGEQIDYSHILYKTVGRVPYILLEGSDEVAYQTERTRYSDQLSNIHSTTDRNECSERESNIYSTVDQNIIFSNFSV